MENETLLIFVVLFCLLVLAVVIVVLVSGRRKESTGFIAPKVPLTGMGNTGMGNTGMGNTGMGNTGMGDTNSLDIGSSYYDTGNTGTGSLNENLKTLIDQWKILEAVKLVRETKNIGLKEAKDYINKFMRGEVPEGIVFEASDEEKLNPEELEDKVFELLLKKKKIEAVKLARENLNIGLKEAKYYVEQIERKT